MKNESNTAPEIRTPRLKLRAFVPTDDTALWSCCRNPRLGDDAGWKPHASVEESQQILHDVFLGRPTVWAVEESSSERLVGAVALMSDPRRCVPGVMMLGYWLDEAYWGRGYMYEAARATIDYAFQTLGVGMLTATCYPHNLRSKRLIDRLGFRYEGCLHRAEHDHRNMTFDLLCHSLEPEKQRPESVPPTDKIKE